MDENSQRLEVDQNYDAFQRTLGSIIDQHRNEYALLRNRTIIGYFAKPGAAYDEGVARFEDGVFSIQEVTDEPVHLGFWSIAAN